MAWGLAAAQIGIPILNYTLTEVDVGKGWVPQGEQWAFYKDGVCDEPGSTVPPTFLFLDSFFPLDVRTDFFYKTNVSLAASSLGFISPAETPMCYSMCVDIYPDTLFGFYQFTNNASQLETLGGDWPAIGLFLSLITPDPAGGRLCKSALTSETLSTGEVVESQTVEYEKFVDSDSMSAAFTGQVTIYSNGTIIFRYRTLPRTPIPSAVGLAPSVGLVLSKAQRLVAATPVPGERMLVARRFDPVRDSCATHASRPACVTTDGCGWCRATQLCVSRSVAEEQCPRGYLDTSSDSPATPAPGTAASFYDLAVTQNSCYHKESQSTYFRRRERTFNLNWTLPFFGKAEAGASKSRVQLFAEGGVFVDPTTPAQNCNPIWGVCPNGNYTNAIAPLLSSLVAVNELGATNPVYLEVALGDDASARLRSPRLVPSSWAKGRAFRAKLLWYELYLDSRGTVEFLFGCDPVLVPPSGRPPGSGGSDASSRSASDSASSGGAGKEEFYALGTVSDYYTYPKAIIGLIRNTVDDPASVVIPPWLIRTGTRIRFTLRTPCPDCGPNGRCDEATQTCVCSAGFAGSRCQACAAGFYGKDCTACPACENGGSCDDGVRGSGKCRCVGNYAGATCATACSATPECDQAACFAGGHGFCGCGGCVCTDGFSGPSCDEVPRDPCLQYAVDGCQQCNALAPECRFCFDSYCYSPERAAAGIGHSCSRPIPGGFTQICRNLYTLSYGGGDLGRVILAVVTVLMALLYMAVIVLGFHFIRFVRSLHSDVHADLAAGGLVDFVALRREREVVQTQLLSEDRHDERRYFLGHAIRQISLKKLYKRQRGIDQQGDGAAAGSGARRH